MKVGVDMKQLKMFSPSQQKCCVCGAAFVPFSRDMVAIWHSQLDLEPDWLYDQKWARDRVYREMQMTCSPGHAEAYAQAAHALAIQEAWERMSRKYR